MGWDSGRVNASSDPTSSFRAGAGDPAVVPNWDKGASTVWDEDVSPEGRTGFGEAAPLGQEQPLRGQNQ